MGEHNGDAPRPLSVPAEELRQIEDDIERRKKFREQFGDPEEEPPDGHHWEALCIPA